MELRAGMYFTQTRETILSKTDNALYASVKLLTPDTFEEWRNFIYEQTGIYYQDNKKYLLESRLQKRMSFLGINSYHEYLDYLKFNPSGTNELRYLFDAITINETFFFRNQAQLDALVTKVFPEIIQSKEKTGSNSLKIWSAGCSSGEEAYSIAIMLNELIRPRYPQITFEIVGTDLSNAMIDAARRAVYREYSIRNAPVYYLKKYFVTEHDVHKLNTDIKNMASFKLLNLYDDVIMKTMIQFDLIFCANVLIYFDQKSKIKVINHLYNSLNKGGYLFIGYSESLHSISKAFKLISFPKTIGYKKE